MRSSVILDCKKMLRRSGFAPYLSLASADDVLVHYAIANLLNLIKQFYLLSRFASIIIQAITTEFSNNKGTF